MKKTISTYKKPIIAGVLLVLILIVYLSRDKIKALFTKTTVSSSPKPIANNYSATVDKGKLLAKGSRGASVEELQRVLNKEWDYQKAQGTSPNIPKLVVDGVFGPKTETMLHLAIGRKSISINELIIILEDQKVGALAAIDWNN